MEIVSFEIAKKLKGKGFPQDTEYCMKWYPTEYYKNSCIGEYFEGELQEVEDFGDRIQAIHIVENEKKGVIAPTISQVLKWLREEKNIEVVASFSYSNKVWGYQVGDMTLSEDSILFHDYSFPTYELAALAGIEYVLNNLI